MNYRNTDKNPKVKKIRRTLSLTQDETQVAPFTSKKIQAL